MRLQPENEDAWSRFARARSAILGRVVGVLQEGRIMSALMAERRERGEEARQESLFEALAPPRAPWAEPPPAAGRHAVGGARDRDQD